MRPLTEEELAEVLATNGVGVLAFRGGDYPYPLPVTFGYRPDRDHLVVQLEGGADSHKQQCLDDDDRVGLTVYEETEPDTRWRSVVLGGRLTEIPYRAAEPAFATLAKHTQFAPNPTTWSDGDEVVPMELRIDERSGREFVVD